MQQLPDHYAALGISPAADQEVIAAAFRALAKKFHPDTGSARGSASPERFRAAQDAWETLGDPERRRRYDALRAAALPPGARAVQPASGQPHARRGYSVPPAPGAHALAGERRIEELAPRRRRRPLMPVSGIAAGLAIMLLAALWLMPQWSAAPDSETAALRQPELPALAEPAATASYAKPEIPPQPAPPVPRARPAAAVQVEDASPPADDAPAGEILFALSIVPEAGGAPIAAESGQVMFSTRSRCENFGAEALERRRAAARGRNEAEPAERFECVEFSARSP